ncbi:MAG: hypothetical protein PCALPYG88_1024 [uncultured Paraburkholderia sp.]|uniref:NmrA family NAD(P)-binding protein n=1 Tax=uncultured Paraburkholderia sp. TaxID=1822466 RepID=UPI0025986F5F|nr:NmrA family NAD(P)-binding protein [uncultured Paraburkholderia sp.]CAH2894702.1 MAG: hypothetical protein PCALPYG08_1086 [uncultured Paraburkholderia sp.]CAH2912830.1 MAG: hypothetical protein PCALPYG88_1024 [uncultured Paraburkholderia sp.]
MMWQSKAFINQAKRSGVKHIVHLGAAGDDDTNVAHWGWHQFVEKYIESTGIAYTHLRPEIYMNNLLGYGGARPIDKGVIRQYVGGVRQCWVANEDIAAVSAVVLRDPAFHAGKTYRLGYDSKSYDEIAEILTRVVGQTFRYEPRSPEEFLKKVLDSGADTAYFECAYRNYTAYSNGTSPGTDYTFDNFPALTGKQPTTWEKFVERNKDTFGY